MKETTFIKRNKDKWAAFERLNAKVVPDPDEMRRRFIEITDDLSYARTFYPKRSVRVYLNNLGMQLYNRYYKRNKMRWQPGRFWLNDLPLTLYHCRRELWLSFIITLLSVAIGMISSYHDSEFLRVTVGQSYVEMTKENIRNGDPMAVYKTGRGLDSFLGITFNNLRVSLYVFILGIFLGAGTLYLMMYNGIMLGSFLFFFIQRGLTYQALLTIWIHGTIEISCIIIAGSAGFTLARGFLFPGTLTRLQSLQVQARHGIRIMIGIAPLIVVAAFLEGFITRLTDMPGIFKLAIIVASLFFMVGYFVILPLLKGRRTDPSKIMRLPSRSGSPQKIRFHVLRKTGEVFSDAFAVLRQTSDKLYRPFSLLMITNFMAVLLFFLTQSSDIGQLLTPSEILNIGMTGIGSMRVLWCIFQVLAVVYGLCAMVFVMRCYETHAPFSWPAFSHFLRHYSWKIIGITAIIYAGFYFLPLPTSILLVLMAPFIWFALLVPVWEKKPPNNKVKTALRMAAGYWGRGMAVFLLISLAGLIFVLIGFSPVYYLVKEFISWHAFANPEYPIIAENIINILLATTLIHLVLPLYHTGFSLAFFSIKELETAAGLREEIKLMTKKYIRNA